MNNVDDEQALLAKIVQLPREIQPRKDLWPAIAARIDPASSTASPRKFRVPSWSTALAASLFVALCAGLFFTSPWDSGPGEGTPGGQFASGDATNSGRPDPASRSAERSATELEYFAAFREFLAIHPEQDGESLLTQDWLRETSGVLYQAEMELAAALDQSPDDPLLQQRMAALRAHQLEWLKRMAAVERNSRRISA